MVSELSCCIGGTSLPLKTVGAFSSSNDVSALEPGQAKAEESRASDRKDETRRMMGDGGGGQVAESGDYRGRWGRGRRALRSRTGCASTESRGREKEPALVDGCVVCRVRHGSDGRRERRPLRQPGSPAAIDTRPPPGPKRQDELWAHYTYNTSNWPVAHCVPITTNCPNCPVSAMRAALRLFAAVKPVGRVLEPGAPTGLTGLLTHAAPRSTLVYLYSKTLDKLSQFPESSVYRQSTEALARHRLSIVERMVPAGLAEWKERVQKEISANPEAFEKHGVAVRHTANGKSFVTVLEAQEVDEREEEWNSEPVEEPALEGIRTPAERANQKEALGYGRPENLDKARAFRIEKEPSLTADQYVAPIRRIRGCEV